MTYDFETQRELNIARNKELIRQLGLGDLKNEIVLSRPKKVPKTKQKAQPKRKRSESDATDEETEKRPRKAAIAVDIADTSSEGPRRSGRNAGRKIDYRGDGEHLARDTGPRLISESARRHEESEVKTPMKRIHNPKVFGSIPGVEVGTWWPTREACSRAAIHARWLAGIAEGPHGAYSVALSGGYEDDVDDGEAFTYTGAGGRDLKGTKNKPKNLRTAPQSSDQTFENKSNQALLKSVETKKPVRVIRGFKLRSPYAPPEGYRYDGLYTVEKAWQEPGLNTKGYLVCKYLLKRIPGQPPLPRYEDRVGASDAASESEEEGGNEDEDEEEDE
ncbi:YDG/SRA domain-containing protein [Phanerochaete sordida]|uniref:YDG/SRA domain-containing protein n=1 Tax=Phanerochaete sordida TaxID=48140 RepID=A0A9P3G0Z7_9APHY|nr:YDG/SRA domain-containing protein [Phanerochaete sordida]